MFRFLPLLLALAMLPLGLLGSRVAQADGAAMAVQVPSLLGKTETEARALLEARGLQVDITYVDDDVAPAGTVISQDPNSGAEILVGATLQLRVTGPAPDAGPTDDAPDAPEADQVAVPALTGLQLKDAEAALIGLGLTPRPDFAKSDAQPAFHVIGQDIAADTLVATGTHIRFDVALGADAPTTLFLPSLYGLSEADALAVLGQLGLDAGIARVHSDLPQGMVFHQHPAAGSEIEAGAMIQLKVAEKPPVDWTPQEAVVPNLHGMSADQARIALLVRGLRSRMQRGLKPNANVHKVFSQNHAPGAKVPVGQRVTFYLPSKALVPNLLGKTKGQAIQALQQAGLQAQASGPVVGVPPSKVIAQNKPAGSTVARGSTVKFSYKFTGVIAIQVHVPNVIGKTKAQAKALIQAKGLLAKLVGPNFGIGGTKVTQQFPAPGTQVAKGSQVTAKYKFTGAIAIKVTVPNIVGKSKAQAKALIEANGLTIKLVGPNFGVGIPKITQQLPAAGTKLFKGAQVTAKFKFKAVVIVPKVTVPNLIGKTKAQALMLLQSKGLKAKFVGIGPKVKTQNKAAGSKVLKGTTVKLKVGF